VQQFEAVFHAAIFEVLDCFERFADSKAEFGAITAGGFPTAGTTAGEFDANADGGFDADAFGMFDDEFEFGIFFDDGCDLPADFFGQHDHFDVFGVFEAVTDDGGGVVGDGEDGEEFGFRAGFETEFVGAAVAENFFDDLALLVDLDGIYAAVGALIAVLADGAFEGLVDFA
jgi:hypothetical protein